MTEYQNEISKWMKIVFNKNIIDNKKERAMRFFEEAAELCQSVGMTKDQAQILIDYTFNRPVGDANNEVGGVMVTLAALCDTCGISMEAEGYIELERISTPEMIKKIQDKQLTKFLIGITPDDL